jgi:uncharacterized lipoprotein YajG
MKINKKNMLNGLVGLMTAGLLLSACKKTDLWMERM